MTASTGLLSVFAAAAAAASAERGLEGATPRRVAACTPQDDSDVCRSIGTSGATMVDIDNDGDLDIYVTHALHLLCIGRALLYLVAHKGWGHCYCN